MKAKSFLIGCAAMCFAVTSAFADSTPRKAQPNQSEGILGLTQPLNQTPIPKGLLERGPDHLLNLDDKAICPIEVPLGEIASIQKDPLCGSFTVCALSGLPQTSTNHLHSPAAVRI